MTRSYFLTVTAPVTLKVHVYSVEENEIHRVAAREVDHLMSVAAAYLHVSAVEKGKLVYHAEPHPAV